jgi:hypothetical protein
MKFANSTFTDIAANTLYEALTASGFAAGEDVPQGSTDKLTKEANGVSQIVLMNVKEQKIDVFHGAFLDNGDKVLHNKWRIQSDRKMEEVSWKIRSATPSATDKVLPSGYQPT